MSSESYNIYIEHSRNIFQICNRVSVVLFVVILYNFKIFSPLFSFYLFFPNWDYFCVYSKNTFTNTFNKLAEPKISGAHYFSFSFINIVVFLNIYCKNNLKLHLKCKKFNKFLKILKLNCKKRWIRFKNNCILFVKFYMY